MGRSTKCARGQEVMPDTLAVLNEPCTWPHRSPLATRHSPLATRHSPLATRRSPLTTPGLEQSEAYAAAAPSTTVLVGNGRLQLPVLRAGLHVVSGDCVTVCWALMKLLSLHEVSLWTPTTMTQAPLSPAAMPPPPPCHRQLPYEAFAKTPFHQPSCRHHLPHEVSVSAHPNPSPH